MVFLSLRCQFGARNLLAFASLYPSFILFKARFQPLKSKKNDFMKKQLKKAEKEYGSFLLRINSLFSSPNLIARTFTLKWITLEKKKFSNQISSKTI